MHTLIGLAKRVLNNIDLLSPNNFVFYQDMLYALKEESKKTYNSGNNNYFLSIFFADNPNIVSHHFTIRFNLVCKTLFHADKDENYIQKIIFSYTFYSFNSTEKNIKELREYIIKRVYCITGYRIEVI